MEIAKPGSHNRQPAPSHRKENTLDQDQITMDRTDTITYSDFEVAYAINTYLDTWREYSQALDAAFRISQRRRTRRSGSLRSAMDGAAKSLLSKAVLLTKMGVNLDDNGFPKGIRVDVKGRFIEFDIKNA